MKYQIVPQADHQISFLLNGIEKSRWHYGPKYPRPFLYPLCGASGISLTRIGHPGAPNHDHHCSVWLAHHDIGGDNHWTNQTLARVEQNRWIAYQDGEQEGVMAVHLIWKSEKGTIKMETDLVVAFREYIEGSLLYELQMRHIAVDESLLLGRTNFGFLGIRMAKELSGYWGAGKITNSHGQEREKAIFGQSSPWMDYGGAHFSGKGRGRKLVKEGITCIEHPSNPGAPTHWHVREDGWMCPSFNFLESYTIKREQPLTLRYLLHARLGELNSSLTQATYQAFSKTSGFKTIKSKKPHQQFEVLRIS